MEKIISKSKCRLKIDLAMKNMENEYRECFGTPLTERLKTDIEASVLKKLFVSAFNSPSQWTAATNLNQVNDLAIHYMMQELNELGGDNLGLFESFFEHKYGNNILYKFPKWIANNQTHRIAERKIDEAVWLTKKSYKTYFGESLCHKTRSKILKQLWENIYFSFIYDCSNCKLFRLNSMLRSVEDVAKYFLFKLLPTEDKTVSNLFISSNEYRLRYYKENDFPLRCPYSWQNIGKNSTDECSSECYRVQRKRHVL
jgi:hypothetical protein